MSAQQLLLLLLVVSAPVTLALIVAMLRGYTIDLRLTREPREGGHWWTRKRDQETED